MSEVLFLESPRHQRPAEAIAYTVDTARYGGSPTGVAVTLVEVAADGAETDRSGANLDGSATVAGHVITTPRVAALVAGRRYRLQVLFTAGGSTWAPILYIHGKP